MTNKHMKESQYLQSLEKSKVKSLRDATVHLLEQRNLERLAIPHSSKDGKEVSSHPLPLKV